MKKQTLVLLGILGIITNNANARNNRRSGYMGGRTKNVNIYGTTTQINATAADTTMVSTDKTKPAPITDAVAQRECYKNVANALEKHCITENKACNNPTEIYAMLTVPDEKFCANFIETAVNKLWNKYDEYTNKDEKNCNIALARSLAAESCYRYALTHQNKQVVIYEGSEEKKEKFGHDTFYKYCGSSAIQTIYDKISKTPGNIDTGDSLPKYFASVGSIGWSNLASYTRLLDGKIDFKTNEYPRELVQLVNSLKSEGNMMCGDKHYTQLYDTNMQLFDKSGSLEKRINEKGIISGTVDWGVDQLGAIKGTDWSNSIKQNGMIKKK